MRYASRILVSNLNFAKFIYKCTRLLERFGETIITILRENYLPNRRDTCFFVLVDRSSFFRNCFWKHKHNACKVVLVYLAEVLLENENEILLFSKIKFFVKQKLENKFRSKFNFEPTKFLKYSGILILFIFFFPFAKLKHNIYCSHKNMYKGLYGSENADLNIQTTPKI